MTQQQPEPYSPAVDQASIVDPRTSVDATAARLVQAEAELREAQATVERVARLLPKWERAAATTHMLDGAKHVMVQVTDELRAVLNGAEPTPPPTSTRRY